MVASMTGIASRPQEKQGRSRGTRKSKKTPPGKSSKISVRELEVGRTLAKSGQPAEAIPFFEKALGDDDG
jgi:hypothetical protein